MEFLRSRLGRLIAGALILALTALPAVHILWIIATTGANNPSNDYLRTIHLIDQILSGGYHWGNYFRDTLQNGIHSYAFLMLVRLGVIRLTHWNIYAELYLGWLLAVLKFFLLYRLLTFMVPRPHSLWILPFLSALVFSTSQISMFTFGETALQQGLIQVGVIVGLLSLLRKPGTWQGAAGASLSGIIASWSGGGGLIAWPVFLLGFVLCRYRKLGLYAALLFGAALALWPYVAYGTLGNPGGVLRMASLERGTLLITALGYPFANGIGSGGLTYHQGAFVAGVLGIILGLSGVLLVVVYKKRRAWQQSVPGFLLMTWGLLNIAQTILSRLLLAPWYTTAFMVFWFGLLGLAYAHGPGSVFPEPDRAVSSRTFRKPEMIWALACLGVLLVLYFPTNLTYEDKSFYLASRSPASAACLRNYRIAPTYCEGLVFQWGVGHPTYLRDLAWPLEKHSLAVFAPHQEWTLQGDYILDRVQLYENPGVPSIAWTSGWSDRPSSWASYQHLNLFLNAPNAISWRDGLPSNLKTAVFKTAVAINKAVPLNSDAGGFEMEIYLQPEGEQRQLVFSSSISPDQYRWEQISLPLTVFAGKSITLYLTSKGSGNPTTGRMMLQYPRIDLDLSPAKLEPVLPEVEPSNTDLSPGFAGVTRDYEVLANSPGSWKVSGVKEKPGEPGTWIIDQQPVFDLQEPLNLCLKDYSQFFVRMSASNTLSPLALRVQYRFEEQTGFNDFQSFWIPLLADGNTHSYLYDLKLISAPAGARLAGLRLEPGIPAKTGVQSEVRIAEAGFVHKEVSGFCDPDQ